MTADTHPPEADQQPFRKPIDWVLYRGDRLVVSALLASLILTILLVLEWADLTALASPTALFYLFSAFIGGNLTLITVVLSINQLVLSRQLQAPGPLRKQIRQTEVFRADVAAVTDQPVTPVLPPQFLERLVRSTNGEARALAQSAGDLDDERVRRDIGALVDPLVADLDRVADSLERSGTSPFHALSAILNTDLATRIQTARHVEAVHGDALPDRVVSRVERLDNKLELLDISREYFKTLFMQKELSYLSRMLLYVGLPAEVSATVVLLVVSSRTGMPPLLAAPGVVPFAVVLSFLPLAVLFSFVLRVATVTERSVAIAPFTTPETIP
ncbi:hypothetical protein ACFQL4_10975 [Halosimplex aquaticum]